MSELFSIQGAELGYSDLAILSNFFWRVHQGERWAIVGPNGAGKTTLVRTILGLIPLRSGAIQFQNNDRSQEKSPISIGYLPQINQMDKAFPISVWEVIDSGLYCSSLPKKQKQERIEYLLGKVGLTSLAHQAIGQLSGGQLQRTLLARALVANPELLVLDEPTSFLDKRYKEQFLRLVEDLVSEETTILLVTHDLPEAELDRWQILSLGQW